MDADKNSQDYRNLMEFSGELVKTIRTHQKPLCRQLYEQGYLRGIDFYSDADLQKVIANILFLYSRESGILPSIINPVLYTEKLNWLKLFKYLKVPHSGNKLLNIHFIPPDFSSELLCPKVVWESETPILPSSVDIEPGYYYLKTNHGSGMCRKIDYPISKDSKQELEIMAQKWLTMSYGIGLGEWWYSAFKPKIFLEESVVARSPSPAFLFYSFYGEIPLISMDEKFLDGNQATRVTHFDEQFNPLSLQPNDSARAETLNISSQIKKKAIEAASAVGGQFDAARVDLLIGDDGKIYLNEITLCSNAGMPFKNKARDKLFGDLWKLDTSF